MQSQHYWLNKTKFKDEMQKPHAAGNEKKNKVKKLQETYRYNEPTFYSYNIHVHVAWISQLIIVMRKFRYSS
jgi:hypothetical protein